MKSKTAARVQKKRTKTQRAAASKAVPATKRAAQKRRELITAAGGRQLNILLKPAPNRALARLMKHHQLPAVQVVTRLLNGAAAQLRKPSTNTKSDAALSTAKSIRPRRSATRRAK